MRTKVEMVRAEVLDSIAVLATQPHNTGEIATQIRERFLAFCEATDDRLGECTAQVFAMTRRSDQR